MIRSYPASSKVFINEQFVGITPVGYRVPSKDIDGEFRVRIERPGYATATGTLQKEVCRGRVVGGVFTFGILFLFRSSTCLVGIHDFALTEMEGQDGATSTAASPSVETRLQRLEKMRREGTISEDEFRRYREAILRDL
jgi:hypothetical protein